MAYSSYNNLICTKQVAFKKKQNTLDYLLHINHFISQGLSHKNHVTILSTDFERAFDRIGVHIVLQEITNWKVGTKIYQIIKSFLTNRYFKVRINSTLSQNYSLFNGIPQGSPFSVTLFLIAFNSISKIDS